MRAHHYTLREVGVTRGYTSQPSVSLPNVLPKQRRIKNKGLTPIHTFDGLSIQQIQKSLISSESMPVCSSMEISLLIKRSSVLVKLPAYKAGSFTCCGGDVRCVLCVLRSWLFARLLSSRSRTPPDRRGCTQLALVEGPFSLIVEIWLCRWGVFVVRWIARLN